MSRAQRLASAWWAGDYDTRQTRGDARAVNALADAGVGILDVAHGTFVPGTVAACGRSSWATPHGAPLFGWRHQRKANARRGMQRARRHARTIVLVEEAPF